MEEGKIDKKQRIIDVISLAKRAGGVILGFDMVKEQILKGSCTAVITASDLSDKSNKEIEYLCGRYDAEHITVPITMDEFWYLIGKRTGIITIANTQLMGKFMEVIADD